MKLLHILHDPTPVSPLKSVVSLSDAERTQLRYLLSVGTAPTRTLTYARILLKADAAPAGPGWTDPQIAEALEVSLTTILRVRRAWKRGGVDAALHRLPPPASTVVPSTAAKRRGWWRWPVAPRRTASPAGA